MLLDWCVQELEGEPSDGTSIHVTHAEETKKKVEREGQKKPGYIVNAENNTKNFCHDILETIKKEDRLLPITRKSLLNRCIEVINKDAPECERVHVKLQSESQLKTERYLEQNFQDQLAVVRSERESLNSEQSALVYKPKTRDIDNRLGFIKRSTSELDKQESSLVEILAKMHMPWSPFSKRDPS